MDDSSVRHGCQSTGRGPRRPSPCFRPRNPGGRALLALAILAPGCGPDGPIVPPEPLPGPSPVEYPLELWDERVEGETILMLRVSEAGVVDSAYVQQSSGLEDFDSAAIRGVRQLRFTPGYQGGSRRAMWTRIPVRFRLDAARDPTPPASASGQSP